MLIKYLLYYQKGQGQIGQRKGSEESLKDLWQKFVHGWDPIFVQNWLLQLPNKNT